MYDPTVGRWNGVDALGEKYYEYSMFSFSANNPVLFCDFDGRDFVISIDPENNSITISGTYYTTEQDRESAEAATQFWNEQSGNFNYITKDGDVERSWNVTFELSVEVVESNEGESDMAALNRSFGEDQSGGANVYMVVNDEQLPENVNGRTTGGNLVRVKDSRKAEDTGAHEIGHTLGLGHFSKGIMTAASTDPRRSSITGRSEVRTMLKPLRGKENPGAGAGAIQNLQAFPRDKDFNKGKVKKREK